MAKGNLILGYGRGAIGDVVLTRSGGQQTSRARNRTPRNPNSPLQVVQRARFRSASGFFTQLGADFFKYAFAKKISESDYNIFVKNNSAVSPLVAKGFYDSPSVMYAPMVMSTGSLRITTEIVYDDTAGAWLMKFKGSSEISANNTYGDFLNYLKRQEGYREGDILTCVGMYSSIQNAYGNMTDAEFAALFNGLTKENRNSAGVVNPFAVNNDRDAEEIYLSQHILGANVKETAIGASGLSLTTSGNDTMTLKVGKSAVSQNQSYYYIEFASNADIATCIVSRKTNAGLSVNSAIMRLNDSAKEAYRHMNSKTWNDNYKRIYADETSAYLKGDN